jgi:hypothetical protein
VNRSLLARTYPHFYAEWAAGAYEAGGTDKEVEARIAASIREAQELLAGRCPKCGAPLARYVDRRPERQGGPSNVPGAWVMYRCSTAPPPGIVRPNSACDFMVDFKEGDEAN